MTQGCPCGAQVRAGYEDAYELTGDWLNSILITATNIAKYGWLIIPWIGSLIGLKVVCGLPQVPMPTFEWADLIQYEVAKRKFHELIANKLYEEGCECIPCPPITGCGQGTKCWTVTDGDGYPRPGFEELYREYHIPSGADLWVSVTGLGCIGNKNGVLITWSIDPAFFGAWGVGVCEGNGTNCVGYSQATQGIAVTICAGGEQQPTSTPVPNPPDGWPDYSYPQPCTNSDICATLGKVEEAVHRMEFLVQVIAGPLYGITAEYTGTFPGLATPITGTLTEWLPRALLAIAPVQPSQLANPDTFPIDGASIVDLDGQSYVTIELTAVPSSLGYRGTGETKQYFGSWSQPGPGYVLVMGQEGVLAEHRLVYGEGTEFPLPATATSLAFQLAAGVDIEVTLWDREL